MSDFLAVLLNIGLAEKLAQETIKNQKLSSTLEADLKLANIEKCDRSIGNLLYYLSSKLPRTASKLAGSSESRAYLLQRITTGDIKSVAQLDAAVTYFKTAQIEPQDLPTKAAEFKTAAGIGVVVTPEAIKATVNKVLEENKAKILENRELAPKLLGQVNKLLPWGDGRAIKAEWDAAVQKFLASVPAAVPAAKAVKPKADEKKGGAPKAAGTPAAAKKSTLDMGENVKELSGRDIPAAKNTPSQLERYQKATNGTVITRFPPEPNGFLHLGHAKAMNFNFDVAAERGGYCILRFDDTNPEAEKQLYIDNIIENVQWITGKNPKVTYSSEYFQQLYDLAVKLIKDGNAYVCHQTRAEVKEFRSARKESPWRNRPVEENLKLFEDMRKGKLKEGSATLRMKGNLEDNNPQMWDIIAYRIKYTPHPHVGDAWCIYPSYDYTHCIIDSLEWIAYSLCTLEFEIRRESYFWLLDVLDLYKPKVWEYSRLNLDHNVMSKRRLLKLVEDKHVTGWDDPRMLTLNGLRRRGYTAEAINNFCDEVGVTRGENNQPMARIEHCVRESLENISTRGMVVIDPIKITLTNVKKDHVEKLKAPNFPFDLDRGYHDITFTSTVYIDRKDFRETDSKDYFGLAPGKEVHLKYAYNIKCVGVEKSNGVVTGLKCEVDFKNTTKCQGKITWVSGRTSTEAPLKVELRQYDVLFKSKEPMKFKGDWLDDINPDSLVVVSALADQSVAAAKPWDRFQFERVGYYICDQDTTKDKVVFNLTVKLKDKLK